MKLGMFYWPCGHHMAAWRHPDGVADSGANIGHIVALAKLAERGLFDLFFMADSVSFWRGDLESMTRDSFGTWIEPFTVMCSLAQHTSRIGLVCTSTTTYDQPYSLARRFASLDVASGGRAGWNLITSANKLEAASFGVDEHLEKTERYRRAREFAHVVRGLWNSWGEGVFVRDKETGLYFDETRLNVLEHEGEHFRVRGPINVPPSPQGEPVMVQAGASDDGRQLAAETAEVIFGAQQTIEGAREFYADVKGRMGGCGRDPDSLKILPGLAVCVAPTQSEAEDKYEQLQDLIDPLAGMQLLSRRVDFDLTGHDVERPAARAAAQQGGVDKGAAVRRDRAAREPHHPRPLPPHRRRARALRDRRHARMRRRHDGGMVRERACDGFNIMPPVFPSSLEDFIDLAIPELQRRGLYRTEYEGTTLRENLGITRPSWP